MQVYFFKDFGTRPNILDGSPQAKHLNFQMVQSVSFIFHKLDFHLGT